jgi:hypothetical protein
MRNWYDTQRHFEARMERDIDLPEQRWEEGSHSGLPLLRMRAIKHAIRTGITTFLVGLVLFETQPHPSF